MSLESWPFGDQPNVAVIVNRTIVTEHAWIAYVSHDSDDGAWQFYTSQTEPVSESDAMLVSLRCVVEIDPTVQQLSDLPLGWHAWRDSASAPWTRAKIAS
ncbi:hypothetical protein GA566_26710 [Cupriavidus sp. SW-Y-13]|nr:hypothetical protein [Cupriavidus sp. SW-Y-13]